MIEREALQVALDMFRSPAQVRNVQRLPLPKNVLQVIRIAAGDAFDQKTLDLTFGWTENEVRDAAVFFLQHILFEKGSHSHRVLGLTEQSDLTALKEHKRALLKWLHPDRNSNRWESVLLQRVLKATDAVNLAMNGAPAPSQKTVVQPLHSLPHQKRRRKAHIYVETKRIRKFSHWREHLISFARRMSLFVAALTIAFLGVRAVVKSEASGQIEKTMQNMLVWLG
jgi:hypothetical protein